MGKKIAPFGSSERFLRAHINYASDDCLLWPYRVNDRGYGLAVIGGVQRAASRWMCRLAHGAPDQLRRHAAHSCGNPACVNPRHLRWTTHRENMFDKERHGTVCRGEKSGKSALTEADVLAIRNAPPKLQPLMERYGMSRCGIAKIRSGKRWAHVGGPRSNNQRGSHPMCRNGHLYDEKNTRWTADGYRVCRACDREVARRRRQSLRGSENGVEFSQ